MNKTQTKKRFGPAPGVKPDTTGVPGEIISLDGLNLAFGTGARQSPYDSLLNQLAAAGAGKALKFGDVRARASLAVRAKKLGLRVSFAAFEGALYVRLDGSAGGDKHATRREQIKGALKFGACTAMKLATVLRGKGDETIDGPMAECILATMMRAGEVVRQDDGGWALAPRMKGAAA